MESIPVNYSGLLVAFWHYPHQAKVSERMLLAFSKLFGIFNPDNVPSNKKAKMPNDAKEIPSETLTSKGKGQNAKKASM